MKSNMNEKKQGNAMYFMSKVIRHVIHAYIPYIRIKKKKKMMSSLTTIKNKLIRMSKLFTEADPFPESREKPDIRYVFCLIFLF